MSDKELNWAKRKLRDSYLSLNERNWLKFIVAMLLWRRRFDIQIGEMPPNHPAVGAYDIEIDG